jgi:hypothetical protein
MLHGCKAGYCLKKDKEGCLHYRFYFPKDLLGFVPKYEDDMDGRGPYLVRLDFLQVQLRELSTLMTTRSHS